MKKRYIVLQEEISDCGVSCLLSIIRYYGGNIPLENLRISTQTSYSGVTALNLINCAKSYGFQAKGYKNKSLNEIHLPAIAHLNINNSLSHFVVIYKINDSSIEIMDPSSGYKKMSLNEFYKHYSGIVLEFIISTKLPKIKQEKIIEKKIKKEMFINYKTIILLTILNIIFILLSIIGSTYISLINKYNIYIISLIFIGINIFALLIKYISDNIREILLNKIDKNIMYDTLNFIINLPLRYIQLKGTGEILKRIEDIDLIKRVKVNSTIKIIQNTIIIIPIITILNIYSKYITILILLFILFYLLINKRYHFKLNELINKEITESTNYNSMLTDTINGIISINHTSSQNYFLNKISSIKQESNKVRLNLTKLLNKYQFINNTLLLITEIIFNIYIYLMIKHNIFSIELYFIINILLGLLLNSILEILSTIPNIKYIKKLNNKTNELLSLKQEEAANINNLGTTIKIDNLSYTYNSINYTLKNINIKFKKGEKYLIKGTSGKGKTTIFKLLTKEIEDYQGTIKIGDTDLKTINKIDIDNKITYISQNEKIFKGTIKENILLGLDVSESLLNKIINICELNKLLSKTAFGIDTFLIGGGEELSGGERQLIIIARNIIRCKDILIIDEATSQISNNIEDKVIKNIIKYYKDKTILFVSHKDKTHLFNNIIELN